MGNRQTEEQTRRQTDRPKACFFPRNEKASSSARSETDDAFLYISNHHTHNHGVKCGCFRVAGDLFAVCRPLFRRGCPFFEHCLCPVPKSFGYKTLSSSNIARKK